MRSWYATYGPYDYQDMAYDLAEQFEAGQNVHSGTLAYLAGFSPDSRASYNWLMDQVAVMYDVAPRPAAYDQEADIGDSEKRTLIGPHVGMTALQVAKQ